MKSVARTIEERPRDSAERVRDIVSLEGEAVERSARRLDPAAVNKALEILENCRGKVIVTGIGKSGVIAQKISQTLTSTGTVSIFLHPSDALHGSLGVIADGDVVIALSNSGETDEILALLPALRQRDVQMISLVGDLNSSLAKASVAALDASVDSEACPLNLAPTASTTVALAIGDALAMALMEAKGLTEEQFAGNHPAGRLGKRLTLRVGDLMHPSPEILSSAGWLEIIRAISKHALGAVNVVAPERHLIGIITDGDLRRTIEMTPAAELDRLTAEKMMTSGPITANAAMLAYDALKLMEQRPSQISVLPVVDDEGKCAGLLRIHDIVRSGL